MNNRIYISDLDGTLLNEHKEVSGVSVTILNELIAKGIHFSIATARTPATVEYLLKDLHISSPIILMNGAALYDLKHHQYLEVEFISESCTKTIIQKLGKLVEEGFIYTVQDHKLIVHYTSLEHLQRKAFYEERKDTPYKYFTSNPLEDYTKVAYFVFLDDKENITHIYNQLKDIEGLALVMYKDIYDEEAYILEIYSKAATKANGIKKLKEKYKYDKIICFGDNLNDLSMFNIADEAYAVANAMEEVKEKATGIIGSHKEDSVAKYIAKHQGE